MSPGDYWTVHAESTSGRTQQGAAYPQARREQPQKGVLDAGAAIAHSNTVPVLLRDRNGTRPLPSAYSPTRHGDTEGARLKFHFTDTFKFYVLCILSSEPKL